MKQDKAVDSSMPLNLFFQIWATFQIHTFCFEKEKWSLGERIHYVNEIPLAYIEVMRISV